MKQNEKFIIESNENNLSKIEQLKIELKVKEDDLQDLRQETRRYESTVSFMNRQLDEERLKLLNAAILDAENQKLKDTITVKEEVIERLYKQYVDYPKRDAACQTDDRILTENRSLR